MKRGEEWAIKMAEQRGYVVVGCTGECDSYFSTGDRLLEFAGCDLDHGWLEITSETDRRDWNAQVKLILGSVAADPNPRSRKHRFYRCRYVAPEARAC